MITFEILSRDLSDALHDFEAGGTYHLTNVAPTGIEELLSEITEIDYTNLSERAVTFNKVYNNGVLQVTIPNKTLSASGNIPVFRYLVITAKDVNNVDTLVGWQDIGVTNLTNGQSIRIVIGTAIYIQDSTLSLPQVTVQNSDESYVELVNSGDILELPDQTVSLLDNGIEIDSYTIPAMTDPIEVEVGVAPIPLTASISSGDNETKWNNTQEVEVVFDVNAPNDMFSVTNAATLLSTYGLTWDEQTRTLSGTPYDNLSTGSNVIPVVFLASDGYSGEETVNLTVVKEIRADIDAVVTPANIKGWWRFSDNTNDGTVISQVNGLHLGGEDLAQTTAARRPMLTDINGKAAGLFPNTMLDFSLGSNITLPAHIFMVCEALPGSNNYFLAASTSERFYYSSGSQAFTTQFASVIETNAVTDAEHAAIFENPLIIEWFLDGSGNITIRVYDGEKYNNTETVAPTGDLTFSGNWSIGAIFNNTGATLGGKVSEVIFYEGILTTDERQDIVGILADEYILQDGLNAAHPHKSQPPFL